MKPIIDPKNRLNQKGQGLIEYLIIVGLVAVAGIAVMSVVGQNVRAQFGNVAKAIQGKTGKFEMDEVTDSQVDRKDMSDFFHGAAKRRNQ